MNPRADFADSRVKTIFLDRDGVINQKMPEGQYVRNIMDFRILPGVAEAIARLKGKRYRRVPVYADTPDQILGIIDVKMFLLDPSDHYTEKLIAPSFVPET